MILRIVSQGKCLLISLSSSPEYWSNLCYAILRSSVSILLSFNGYLTDVVFLVDGYNIRRGCSQDFFCISHFGSFDEKFRLYSGVSNECIILELELILIFLVSIFLYVYLIVTGNGLDTVISNKFWTVSRTLYYLVNRNNVWQVLESWLICFSSCASQIASLFIRYGRTFEQMFSF